MNNETQNKLDFKAIKSECFKFEYKWIMELEWKRLTTKNVNISREKQKVKKIN